MAKFECSIIATMSNTVKQIQRIQDQVHALIERYRLTVDDMEKQALELDTLKQELVQERKKVLELKSEIEQLRLLMAFNGSHEDRRALKQQLNEWVREINKCVAQLNA